MKKIFSLKSFWTVFALAAGLFFLVFLDINQSFSARTHLLILPQNETTALNFPYILENLLVLADTSENTQGSKMAARQLGESGVVEISTQGESALGVQISSQKATRDILDKATTYYDIKKDLSFKILGTEVFSRSFSRFFLSAAESLLLAFLLSFLSFTFSFFVFKKRETFSEIKPTTFPWSEKMQKNTTLNEAAAWLPQKQAQEKTKPEKTEVLITNPVINYSPCKTAAAPDNLPIAPEESIIKKEETSIFLADADKEKTPLIREATPEEIKERLNKLLSGKF